jgi:hypothetical protein
MILKKSHFKSLYFMLLFLSIPAITSASLVQVGLWGGYNYTEGNYINRIKGDFAINPSQDLFALGLYFNAGADQYQLTINFDYYNFYSYKGTKHLKNVNGNWVVDNAVNTQFDLNYQVINCLFGFRLVPWNKWYIGTAAGPIFGIKKPEIGDIRYVRYGDFMLIGLKAYTGYDIYLTPNAGISVLFSIFWGFAEKSVTRSYTPSLAVFYQL